MSKRVQPEQQAPPAQRLRMRYAKRGTARFSSSRDFSRALERALRRATIPMAFSSGFSPHPRISYANSAPTGAATEAEYVELGLAQVCDPSKVQQALNEALPPGISIEQTVESGRISWPDLLTASSWRIDVDVDRVAAETAVAKFLAASEVTVERMTKSGMRTFDARAAVVELRVVADKQLELLSLQGTPLVRPDDVVSGMRTVCDKFCPRGPVLLHRLAQGPLVSGKLVDPLTVEVSSQE